MIRLYQFILLILLSIACAPGDAEQNFGEVQDVNDLEDPFKAEAKGVNVKYNLAGYVEQENITITVDCESEEGADLILRDKDNLLTVVMPSIPESGRYEYEGTETFQYITFTHGDLTFTNSDPTECLNFITLEEGGIPQGTFNCLNLVASPSNEIIHINGKFDCRR